MSPKAMAHFFLYRGADMPKLKSNLTWTAAIDGNDLVVSSIEATCFGGAHDPQDNGKTASGIPNDGTDLTLMGVALPVVKSDKKTTASPLPFFPRIPWKTKVIVWCGDDPSHTVECILIDNGPDVADNPTHALDLNPNVILKFDPTADPMKIASSWSKPNFFYRIVGAAKFVPHSSILN
jgi:hypothetical protein